MNEEKTDESLKSFLFTFKIHIDQFNEIIHDLYQQITQGSQAIDQVFIETNEQMWKDIEQQQQQLADEIASLRKEPATTDPKASDKLLRLLHMSDTAEDE